MPELAETLMLQVRTFHYLKYRRFRFYKSLKFLVLYFVMQKEDLMPLCKPLSVTKLV